MRVECKRVIGYSASAMSSTASRSGGSLPTPRTRLIGRAGESAAAHEFLLYDALPLLTLSGPGGVGKTLLALTIAQEVSAQFAEGVVYVDLSSLMDPALVVTDLANTFGVIPAPERSNLDALTAYLHARQLLLVLDNCEHLLAAVADLVATLLTSCPAMQVLATSRAPLQIRGEQVLRVPPLPVPGADLQAVEVIRDVPSVALFERRAQAADPLFALTARNANAVAALCRQLDGLPLAIELAAARSTVLSPAELVDQMTDRLTLLRDGPRDLPVRQRTIENTIAWSYDLLSAEAQALLRRLAVFVGGFTREAGSTVMTAGGAESTALRALAQLVDYSLVLRLDSGDQPRFSMLETVRAFALVQLAACEEVTLARSAMVTYLTDLGASAPVNVYFGPYQATWYARADAEIDNIRASMAWLMETGDGLRTLRLLVAFDDYWSARRYRAESWRWAEFGLDAAPDAPPHLRAAALHVAVFSARAVGDFQAALTYAQAGIAVAQTLNDPVALGRSYYQLGNAWHHIDPHRAAEATAQAVALNRDTGDLNWLGVVLADLGDKLHSCGDLAAAAPLIDEGIALNRRNGHTWGIAQAVGQRGHVALAQGDLPCATQCFHELIPLARELGDEHMVMGAVAGLAGVALAHGQPPRAARLLGAVMAEQERSGWPRVAHPLHVARITKEVRAALGDAAFVDALAIGQATPFAAALAEAIIIPQAADSGALEPTTAPHPLSTHPELTPREQEVLVLLCQRRTNAEIAATLFLSPRTIEAHVTHLLGKLGATNRRDAGAIAARLGLV